MKSIEHKVDFCIVGGGLAGLCAGIAAARHGAEVILMQDRPVLGGNSSSEIRMHICGADRSDGLGLRESGIIEEIELTNKYLNPHGNFSIWDSVLYGIAREQKGLRLLLNCSCNDAVMDNTTIVSIKGWQGTAETWHIVKAKIFADCSGDSILAPLTGAEFRIGRESMSEYGESIEPETADKKTMGMSCLIQTREHDKKINFTPPKWAWNINDLPKKILELRGHCQENDTNFWWLELGGENDSIHDTEYLRDELLALGYGIWDHIKNDGDHGYDNYSLEWIGFLPGKRESRRYIGDYILTQNDVQSCKKFDDTIAYGGWSMDDHHPAGFMHEGEPTIFHTAPQPYLIPYRILYSKNIDNLMFAGRNVSASHAAMSSTRVMGTCSVMGQAMGTAAAIAINKNTNPRGIYNDHIKELQNTLLEDGCFLPWHKKEISDITKNADITSDTHDEHKLINGIDRNFEGDNFWEGSWVAFDFKETVHVKNIRLVFYSILERKEKNMPHDYKKEPYNFSPPARLAKDFDIIIENKENKEEIKYRNNYLNLIQLPLDCLASKIKLKIHSNWADEKKTRVFSVEIR